MNNLQIYEKAKRLNIKHFKNVLTIDCLPLKKHDRECFVINLDKSTGKGTHWVGLYKNECKCVYVDNLGLPPPPEIKEYIGNEVDIELNETPVSTPKGLNCGMF